MTETPETQTLSTQPERTTFWRRKPTLWIAAGLGAAALLVGGIGVGSAMAGDDDDDRPAATGTADVSDDVDDADDQQPAAEPAPASGAYGAKDAAALSDVLAAARTEAKGTPTSMEANRNGSWSVDLERANGDETTVLVTSDGSASVVRTEAAEADDANDPAPAGTLDDKSLAAVVKAALAESAGVIVDVGVDDNPSEAYSVQVLAKDGTEVELDLSTDFTVTQVDRDQD
jgi:hypothetical protein